jgi:glycosyltransferase involved in cell wall biosynthesis
MRILQIHNFYLRSGGEDFAFNSEAELLRSRGNEVIQYTINNNLIKNISKVKLLFKTIWNIRTYKEIEKLIISIQPDICHFHNTFPVISPSAYYACVKHNVPVIQTLHNYRLICPSAILFRDGHICEDCLGKFFPWPGILHKCYHDSHGQTSVIALMLAIHKVLHTWSNNVSQFIALSEFSKNKFTNGGLNPAKIKVSPNFIIKDPGKKRDIGTNAIFVGRLSQEKGLVTLIEAWKYIHDIPLKIIGEGPMMNILIDLVEKNSLKNIELLGHLSHQEVIWQMKNARTLIFPSECYENFPLTIIEAYACGLPVIASRLGVMKSIVLDGRTGLLFNPNDPQDLDKKILSCWYDGSKLKQMGEEARIEYTKKYSGEKKYSSLLSIYTQAINEIN